MIFTLKNVVCSFPTLFEARDFRGDGKLRWGITALIEKDDPQVKLLDEAIKRALTETFKAEAPGVIKELKATPPRYLLTDGDVKASTPGYEGRMFVNTSRDVTKSPPVLIDRAKKPITKEGVIYGGCIVNVQFDVWVQNNGYGKRVNAELLAVQFVGDGTAFSKEARPDLESFEMIEDSGDVDFSSLAD